MADETKDAFMALARKRFAAAAEDEKHLRDKFCDDLRFASPDGDDQWDPNVKMQRLAAGRPTLAFPRCHTFVQQVSNEARQNKPQIKFSPRLDADKETAEIYEGLARYIQYTSEAQIAYETAVEYSAGGSFGYYRFMTNYVDDENDDLELGIIPVLDPLAIYGILVPACFNRKPKFAFVVEDMPKDEFKAIYPDSQLASLSWAEAGAEGEGWVGSETVRIAEYWYVEEGKAEKDKRKPKPKVKFCKINGFEVLAGSETEWPGSTIPIIPVLGKQMIIDGKPRLFSVVRPQKAAQQLINYSKSRIAETLSTAPISPFIMVEGQVNGYEKEWETLNTVQRPYLTVKSVDIEGRPAPMPQRQTFEPPIQAYSAFVMQEIDDMKATTGIYDASLGSQGNENSGVAIARRQQQSNLSTMHFMDNLGRAFQEGGDVMLEVIPLVYDAPRIIRITGKDESPDVVQINKEHVNPKTGKKQHFDMTAGKYDVVVTMGRAFSSKRMESFDMMQQVIQSSPQSFPMMADILFRNSDTAGADQLAERFYKMLPPNLQDNKDGEQIPPQAQAQIQQTQQHLQALNAHAQVLEKQLGQLQFEKTAKVVEHQGRMEEIQAKMQADMALEDKRLLAQVTIAEISTKAQNAADRESDRAALEAQFHEQSHDVAMQAQGAQQAQQMAAQQAQHQQDAQAQQADSQSAQSAQDAAQSQQAQQQEATSNQDGASVQA